MILPPHAHFECQTEQYEVSSATSESDQASTKDFPIHHPHAGALTTRNDRRISIKFAELDPDAVEKESRQTADSSNMTESQKMEMEYFKKRDPMKEFFTLTCQSVKLNSPHLNMILNIKSDPLYEMALTESVPFFKWYSWLESTIQREMIAQIVGRKKGLP